MATFTDMNSLPSRQQKYFLTIMFFRFQMVLLSSYAINNHILIGTNFISSKNIFTKPITANILVAYL